MENTKIEWAHHTVNFWWGCTKVSEACRNCYAEMLNRIFSQGRAAWGPTGARWIRDERAVKEMARINRRAAAAGIRQRVFVNSMSDTFEQRDDLDGARAALFKACELATSLDCLLLTKRPGDVVGSVPRHWLENWPANVWIGTTVEDQETAQDRIWRLLCVPARVRFLSVEPMLAPVTLCPGTFDPPGSGFALMDGFGRVDGENPPGINWVICGGESGARARPMHPAWARSLRDQCVAAGVAFFFKQWGEWLPGEATADSGTCYRSCATGQILPHTGNPARQNFGTHPNPYSGPLTTVRVGTKVSGRLLDGREWSEFPTP